MKFLKCLLECLLWIMILMFVLYGVYTRFTNPELTETQLFLKLIGLNV